jgi:aspartate kinase
MKGKYAVSLTGSQAGIMTTSNHAESMIVDVRPHRVLKFLEQGKIVIVAGFQGVSKEGEITTLGRGGSDTTAVKPLIHRKFLISGILCT